MSNHPTIAALEVALESERRYLANAHAKHPIQDNHAAVIYAHEAATERLMTIVEKAVEVIQEAAYYCQDQIARTNKAIETDCPQCDYQCEGCIHSIDDTERLKRIAKEFLSTLADASGEIKKDGK